MSKIRVGRGPTAKRYNYSRSLAWQWLTAHRPDIIALIWEETYKKYPTVSNYQKAANVFPDSLKRRK